MKRIPGFDIPYFITEDGKVYREMVYKTLYRNSGNKYRRILGKMIGANNYEYWAFGLYLGKIQKWLKIHRLVAQIFIPNPNNYPMVLHKDNNRFNNHKDNLYWGTAKMNIDDRGKSGNECNQYGPYKRRINKERI